MITDMSKIFFAGIDWGGTFIKLGIFNEKGGLLLKEHIESRELARPAKFFVFLKNLFARRFKEKGFGLNRLKGVGVGAPGMIETESGRIYYLPNVKGWEDFPFKKTFEEKISLPVAIDNDANAAALAELKRGKAKASKRAVLFTLGTGLGCGLILNGDVFHGKASAAEAGHIPVSLDGDICGCGAKGCVETFLGNKYFVNKAKLIFKKYRYVLKNLENLTPEDIHTLALKRNKAALESWKYYGYVLGRFCCGLVNLLNLEKIVLGGGLSKAHRFFKPEMQRVIRTQAMRPLNRQVKIEISTLGDDLGVIGAYELIKTRMIADSDCLSMQ